MLELRMYGLTPYQLNGRQIGIQHGHGTDVWALTILKSVLGKGVTALADEEVEKYLDWLENWKTYIVLNGGTTNLNPERPGTLNIHLQTLRENGIFCTEFYEPDLGDQLTAVNFIVDERVFLKDKNKRYVYHEFEDWINFNPHMFHESVMKELKEKFGKDFFRKVRDYFKNSENEIDRAYYQMWVDYMGGEKNVFLRDFLKGFSLA